MSDSNKRLTLRDLTVMSDEERLNALFMREDSGSVIRDWYRRRFALDGSGSGNLHEWHTAPLLNKLDKANARIAALEEQLFDVVPVEEISGVNPNSEPYQLAEMMLNSGYRCENMRAPRTALARLKVARSDRSTWADTGKRPVEVAEAIKRFWSAAIHSWKLWKAEGED